MVKLTPPSPQHPKRRYLFFQTHPDYKGAKEEMRKILVKHPNLFKVKKPKPSIKPKTVKDKEILTEGYAVGTVSNFEEKPKPKPKTKKKLLDKILGWFKK